MLYLISFLLGAQITLMSVAFMLEGTAWNPKEVLRPTITYYKELCHGRPVPSLAGEYLQMGMEY